MPWWLQECEKCGSKNIKDETHSAKGAITDTYNYKTEQLEEAEITEHWIEITCADCKHVRCVGL